MELSSIYTCGQDRCSYSRSDNRIDAARAKSNVVRFAISLRSKGYSEMPGITKYFVREYTGGDGDGVWNVGDHVIQHVRRIVIPAAQCIFVKSVVRH